MKWPPYSRICYTILIVAQEPPGQAQEAQKHLQVQQGSMHDEEAEKHMGVTIGVQQTVIEVHLPQLFPTMTQMDLLTIEQWHVQENDVVQPGELLVSVEAPLGFFDIPTPPNVTTPCRVIQIAKQQGAFVRQDDLLLTLELEKKTAE